MRISKVVILRPQRRVFERYDHSEMSNIVEMGTALREISLTYSQLPFLYFGKVTQIRWDLGKLLPRSPSKLTALKKYGHDIDVGDGPKMVEFHD